MTKAYTVKMLTLAAPCAAAIVLGCNVQNPQPFDPRGMGDYQREAARDNVSTPMRPLPTTMESPFVIDNRAAINRPTTAPTTGPSLDTDRVLRMPLQEIIQRAVISNTDVKVAGYGPAIEAARTVEAEARFDPTFFANIQYERRDNASAFSDFGGNQLSDRSDRLTGQTGLRQVLPSGGQVELRYQAVRSDVSQTPFTSPGIDPAYENELVLQVTQPLLRDFGLEVNRARISISRNNERISVLEFRRQLEETITNIERTYWQLVAAERDVRNLEQLLERTVDTAKLLFDRRANDVTRLELAQANSSIESRRAALIRARARVRDLSDQLKRFMSDPEIPTASGILVLPASTPAEMPVKFDLVDQIETALESRFELGQQQLRVESADTALGVAKNNLQPSLNVVGQVGVQGLDDQFGGAVSDQLKAENVSWSLGLQLEIPIGNRAARSIYRRAQLQRLQAIEQYRSSIEQITLEVKTSLREVETTWMEIVATRQARFAAEEQLTAVNLRRDGGERLTPTFVQLQLDIQERLVVSQQAENQAIANYNIALARLEAAKGTLLRYNNVMLEENRGR